MATASKTIYTHTCDFCGAEHPRGELRRLGETTIDESMTRMSKPSLKNDTVDVCAACQEKPISELIAKLDEFPERDSFGNIVQTVKVRTA